MSEPIKVGDLVQVVRMFCEIHDQKGPGQIFVVDAIEPARDYQCFKGGHRHGPILRQGEPLVHGNCGRGPGFYPMSHVRRIPPLSELDDVKRDEEITA